MTTVTLRSEYRHSRPHGQLLRRTTYSKGGPAIMCRSALVVATTAMYHDCNTDATTMKNTVSNIAGDSTQPHSGNLSGTDKAA